MIIHTASVDGINPATNLPLSLIAFLEMSTTTNTLKHLRDQFLLHKCICGISSGTSTAMYIGYFAWLSPNIPSNFTSFALPAIRGNHLDMVSLAIKAAEDNRPETTDTKYLSKLNLSDAKTTNALCRMLHNTAALAAEITNNLSIMTKQLYIWAGFIKDNKVHLDKLGKEDLHLFNKILYIVDNAKDQFLQSCQMGKIYPALLNFLTTQARFFSRQIFVQLPPIILAISSPHIDTTQDQPIHQ
eukprot:945529-Ditylum_brightwellii.AAC.1